MDPLFPTLPEDLSTLDREALNALEAEHVSALQLVREQDAAFLGDLNATQIVAETRIGKAQLDAIRAAQAELTASEETFLAEIDTLTADAAEPTDELAAEAEVPEAEQVVEPEPVVEETVEEPVLASAEEVVPVMRRPAPQPTRERLAVIPDEKPRGAVLVAAGYTGEWITPGTPFGPSDLSKALVEKARRLGRPRKSETGVEEKYLLASAAFDFPEERRLTDNLSHNSEKIRSLVNTEGRSLVASGGLCAPLTPLYTIPQFATNARPVRDSLPSFTADRGGVNVPVPTTLAAAADAITLITAADDALGGTFATKSCLDQTCLDFVETAVTIISHCREYGNLNARAWPESITFENEITMSEHARVADSYLLTRIREQSLQVTAADVYSTTYDLIYALVRAVASIRYNLRTSPGMRFRALIPDWVPDQMVADIAATQFDRFVNRARVAEILRNAGVEPTFYIDTPLAGTSQAFPAEVTNTTLDNFPLAAQIGVYPEGAFIHVDGGVLELGLVRDSTLNSTNDFQFFGESFENVALLAPIQATRWITATICPSGEFPALATALACA